MENTLLLYICIVLLIVLIIFICVNIAILEEDKPKKVHTSLITRNSLPKCVYPNGSQTDINMRNWTWVPECKTKPNFMIKSEWPSYLTYEAWDSCQGCKSAGGGSDSTATSFQIIGDWLRIAQRNGGDVSIVSGASSKKHWFNPPRNNTLDEPLEIEWYMYLDASNWGKTQEQIIASGLTDNNWSGFWAFGHGDTDKYGWPQSGEWDMAEWLPTFAGPKDGKGCASGLHNAVSGAFPPCCLKRDDIMFPKVGDIGAEKSPVGSDLLWSGGGSGETFRSWGFLMNKNKDPKWNKDYYTSDAITYNNVMHCFLRCTNNQLTIWAKEEADPRNPPSIHTSPLMSNDDVSKLFENYNYTCVSNNYADFGSNEDTTFADAFPDRAGYGGKANKSTNWHQNMFFVWSVILSHNGLRMTEKDGPNYYKPLSFYLSDIHLRGGGNYKKAMGPKGVVDEELIKIATETSPTDVEKICSWLDNSSQVQNVCNNRLQRYASDQFKKCTN